MRYEEAYQYDGFHEAFIIGEPSVAAIEDINRIYLTFFEVLEASFGVDGTRSPESWLCYREVEVATVRGIPMYPFSAYTSGILAATLCRQNGQESQQ